jgi:lysyl-tRNA synthetase class 2
MALRRFGKAAFAVLFRSIRPAPSVPEKRRPRGGRIRAFPEDLDVGDILWVDGALFVTKTGELTGDARRYRLLTKALRPLPEKWHGLSDVETRYRQRYVDLLVNDEVRGIFVRRNRIISFLRDYLSRRDFREVETPISAGGGGATARPFVTHHNALDMDPLLPDRPRALLSGAPSGDWRRCSRSTGTSGTRGSTPAHPEFTMLEFYQHNPPSRT